MTQIFRLTRRAFLRHSAAAVTAGAAGTWPVRIRAEDSRSYLLGTGTTGGTYYPVGVAIATLIKLQLQPKAKSPCRRSLPPGRARTSSCCARTRCSSP